MITCQKCLTPKLKKAYVSNEHMINGVYPWCRECVAKLETKQQYAVYRRCYMKSYMPSYRTNHPAPTTRTRWRVVGVGEVAFDRGTSKGYLKAPLSIAIPFLRGVKAKIKSFDGELFRFTCPGLYATLERLGSEGKATRSAWRRPQ